MYLISLLTFLCFHGSNSVDVCPSSDGTTAFRGFTAVDDFTKLSGTKCECGSKECGIGQLCNKNVEKSTTPDKCNCCGNGGGPFTFNGQCKCRNNNNDCSDRNLCMSNNGCNPQPVTSIVATCEFETCPTDQMWMGAKDGDGNDCSCLLDNGSKEGENRRTQVKDSCKGTSEKSCKNWVRVVGV